MHDSVNTAGAVSSQDTASEAGLIYRLESIPFSRWHSKARILIGSATFFDAFDALSLAFVLPVLIGLWHITPVQIGILISSSYVGQLVGALVFGWLAERYGRIHSIAGAMGIMSVMSIACALCGNFTILFWCRFIQGIGIGGEMPVAAAYISELSKAQGRGKYFLLYELLFPIGLMVTGQIGAFLVPKIGWEIMVWIGGIAGCIITVCIYRLPESPRWLISKNRFAEADAIVQQAERSTDRRVIPSEATRAAIKLYELGGDDGHSRFRRNSGFKYRSLGSDRSRQRRVFCNDRFPADSHGQH